MSFTALQRAFTTSPLSLSFLRCSLSSSARPPQKRDPKLRLTHSPPETIQTPKDFLKAIGRESDTKLSPESWTQFWKMDGRAMRAAGVNVKDRKYILWCKEKYRLGHAINTFSHEPSPKKTVRGWGPKVQNGKRIRSRRIKNK